MHALRSIALFLTVGLGLATSSATPVAAGPWVDGPAAGSRDAGPLAIAAPATLLSPAITYQGYLTDAAGVPLAGSHVLVFQLWDAETGGSQLGTDLSSGSVAVTDGLFEVDLPVDPVHFDGRGLWLRVSVDGAWLDPRQPLRPVPYALGLRPGAVVDGDTAGPTLSVRNGDVGGTAISAAGEILGLDALGSTGVRAVGRGVGLEAQGMTGVLAEGDVGVNATGLVGVRAQSQVGRAVEGTSGSGDGVYGESTGGHGVRGYGHMDSGVYGRTSGGFASGVEGHGPTGVFGTGALVGVSGYTEPDGGTGVLGTAKGNGSTGVYGTTDGYAGKGVHGSAQFGVGVEGEGEIGVKGKGTVNAGVVGEGVFGVSGTGTTAGVSGFSTNGTGVFASGSGVWANQAALRSENNNTSQGVAAYFTNQSTFVNTHLFNSGSGEVLILQSNGGRFMSAMAAGWETRFRLDYDGHGYADGTWHAGGADYAELLPAVSGLAPGDVLAIGEDGLLERCGSAWSTAVAGVYSTDPGFVAGQGADAAPDGRVPLAVVGVVPVRASAENGPIAPGDLLVSAHRAGHAMRAGEDPPQGTVIGKALSGLADGSGIVRMLAGLQ